MSKEGVRFDPESTMNASADGSRPIPPWFENAKLGIFVHWGLYSVPAFADPGAPDPDQFMRDLAAMKDVGGRIPYAEWYLNGLRIPGSATAEHHSRTYGEQSSYFDFQRPFHEHARTVQFEDWADLFAAAGARYVVMVTRHLDGYPLWPTDVVNPHMPRGYRSARDLVGDLATAVRARGMRMGTYYAGGTDWTFTQRPVRTALDFVAQSALGPQYADYVAAHLRELVDRYQPSVLWNDLGWPPDADLAALRRHFHDAVPDGVINDRWFNYVTPPGAGPAPPHDFRTFEYEVPSDPPTGPWEMTRALGRSFGYDADEDPADLLDGGQLVDLLVTVVAGGGNLLLNIGPDGTGRIPEVQRSPVLALGRWLEANGEAIYGTRRRKVPAADTSSGLTARFTEDDGHVYTVVPAGQDRGELVVPDLSPSEVADAYALDSHEPAVWTADAGTVRLRLPAAQTVGRTPYVIAMRRAPNQPHTPGQRAPAPVDKG
jgi:alpha-L-fucosidase